VVSVMCFNESVSLPHGYRHYSYLWRLLPCDKRSPVKVSVCIE
jgi:hypothetical protein